MYVLPQGLFETLYEPVKIGFLIGNILMILIIGFIMLKSSKKYYVWFIFHFIWLIIAGYFLFDALNPVVSPDIPQSAVYIEVKFRFISAGTLWIVGLTAVILKLIKTYKNNKISN